MFNVFSDFHHSGLLNSLILLFEKRLGGNLYRPIGTDWYTNGYWKIYDHPATVEQYLGINGNTPDDTPKLNQVSEKVPAIFTNKDLVNSFEYYKCQDIDSGMTNKAITLGTFMKIPIDIIIASIPQHIEPFMKLCNLHPSHPKLIFQIGNQWTPNNAFNVMASARIKDVPKNINFIEYHQEFDRTIFSPKIPTKKTIPDKVISSFVNCFNTDGLFREDWDLFQKIEKLMPDYKFNCYGAGGRDGSANGSFEVSKFITDSMFIWHTKRGGDGYGHIIHNAPAIGRPLIVKKEYYLDKLAENLLIDGETCVTIDGLSSEEIIKKIVYYSYPKRYIEMCQNSYYNFNLNVSFNEEELKIREFLQKLI